MYTSNIHAHMTKIGRRQNIILPSPKAPQLHLLSTYIFRHLSVAAIVSSSQNSSHRHFESVSYDLGSISLFVSSSFVKASNLC